MADYYGISASDLMRRAETLRDRNDLIERAAIVNRSNSRLLVYSERTLHTFLELRAATAATTPVMRAAGYVSTPPVFPLSHDIDGIIADIAAHITQSDQPQDATQILQSLGHRRHIINRWPRLDLPTFTYRVTGILPDEHGLYHPDQPWDAHLGTQSLVTNTMLRILQRDPPPTPQYLLDETLRIIRHLLPDSHTQKSARLTDRPLR